MVCGSRRSLWERKFIFRKLFLQAIFTLVQDFYEIILLILELVNKPNNNELLHFYGAENDQPMIKTIFGAIEVLIVLGKIN